MQNILDLDDESTWPEQLRACLGSYRGLFLDWQSGNGKASSQHYDQAIRDLLELLRQDHVLRGYHCTRLTGREIQRILDTGMQLPNLEALHERISSLEEEGLVDSEVSTSLRNRNQADDSNRADRICFCFFPPFYAGQRGIERFFRSWGGEALYNSHERDRVSGPALNKIGTPCIVEAYVPTRSLRIHGCFCQANRECVCQSGVAQFDDREWPTLVPE